MVEHCPAQVTAAVVVVSTQGRAPVAVQQGNALMSGLAYALPVPAREQDRQTHRDEGRRHCCSTSLLVFAGDLHGILFLHGTADVSQVGTH